MATFNNLKDYCKDQATRLRGIAHTEKDKHFYRLNIEDILLGEKDLNYPIYSLENYEFNYKDNKAGKRRKGMTCAIVIGKRLSKTCSAEDIEQAFVECEQIGDEIFVSMANDAATREHPFLKGFDLDNVSGVQFTAPDRVYAIRYVFELDALAPLKTNPDLWIKAE
ncbi:hypothetical protein DF185_19965 [Marinifilum breve]|uniref:Uncharacterized protein n=1 Tax=Marinifilum breve TaxID=2184082 RepID=A0A2V3ZT78_9BACT|nr:hypothetical protein [Marinifilum breve]PXX96919.1 hypothetical protein DF185_19965 [Marinifilum breve]